MKSSNNPKLKRQSWQLMLLVLSLSVTGCAAISKPAVTPYPTLPAPPQPLTLKPSTSYSQSASNDIQKWRERLMLTPLTPVDSSIAGKP